MIENSHLKMVNSLDLKMEPLKKPVRLSLELDPDGAGGFSLQIAPVAETTAEPYVSIAVDSQTTKARVSWPEWEDFIGTSESATSNLDLVELIEALL